MEAFSPKTYDDKLAVGVLDGLLLSQLGGPGSPNLYRDPDSRRAVLARLREWRGEVPGGYDPGWTSLSKPSSGGYWAIAQPRLMKRYKQVSDYAAVASDDRFYQAQLEFTALQKRNPGGFLDGTADSNRAKSLQAIMARIYKEQSNWATELEAVQTDKALQPTPDAAADRRP